MSNTIIDLNSNITSTKNQILVQLSQYQRKNLPYKLKLDFDDIQRIIENIDTSPFDDEECCIWNGYITYNNDKCKYINFYFKHRKIALHRLLYINYVGNLENKNYLKFTCNNKGTCCNIKHIEKCNLTSVSKEPNTGKTIINKTTPSIQVTRVATVNNKPNNNRLIVVWN